ncbi:MAG TPA: phosphotransferase [Streptosporangiaceae bacterium]|nr:phosphotransferase [Streptosporangiaceae bacterium]
MFTRPDDLTDGQIRAELSASWNFAAETLNYLPVGFGSHHWRATDAAGRQLFLTVHDLPQMLRSRLDTTQAAFDRLERAFACALSLCRDANLEFVIAPVPTISSKVVRRLADRYSLAACPYLSDCEPGYAGEFPPADRPAVMRLLTGLHQARPAVPPQQCDFELQNADGLKAAMGSTGEPWRTGPYGEQARVLLARHAAGVSALIAAYGELARKVRSRPERFVITHGEPGPWNVLKTPAGFVVVDWDFVQLAPPERDLWELAETDYSALTAYTEATGTAIDSGALALFRMWYDLSEIAGYIELFRGAHDDTKDAAESWKNLEYFLRPAERWPQLRLPAP